MTIPSITLMPAPPSRSDAPPDFTAKADAYLAAEADLVVEINATVGAINAASITIDASVVEATAQAVAAAGSAGSAAAVAAGVGDAVDNAEAAAAAAQAAAGLPALTGNKRKPLAVSDNELLATFRDELSLAKYIDLAVVNAAATGTVTLNMLLGSVHVLTLTGNTTLAVSNLPVLSGEVLSIVVRVTQGATARTLTWFAGITWLNANGVPLAPAANKTIEYILTYNGSAWVGRRGAGN